MCPVSSPSPHPLSVPPAPAHPTAQQAPPPEPHSFAPHPSYSQLPAHPHSYAHSHLPQQLWHQTHIPLQSSRGRSTPNAMHPMHPPSHTHHISAPESQHRPQHHFQEPNQPSQSHSLTALVHPTATSAQMQVSSAIPQPSVPPQIPSVVPPLQQQQQRQHQHQQSTSEHSPTHSQHQVVPPPHPPPPPPHPDRAHHPVHYQHTVNVVAQHRPAHPYVYTVHHPQIMGPVAHVPIGAAPYAHLPPSVWSPAHPSYHPSGAIPPVGQHVQVHPSHHPAASQLHHISSQPAPPHPMYSHPVPQASVPHTSIHRTTVSPQTYVYQYSHVQQPPPPPTSHPGTHIKEHKISPPSSAPHYSQGAPVAVPAESTNGFVKREEKATVTYNNNASHFDGDRGPQVVDNQKQRLNSRAALPYTPSCQSEYMTDGAKASSAQRHQNKCSLSKGVNGAHALAENAKKSPQRNRSQHSPGQTIRKPRKPYTITKSREVWTPEEHNRFLNALQLYDRDWKKIESYIGTKTVLQIRSHAQKHFGKVTKYKTGEYIPPPRPKKKATLPYPRSRSSSGSKSGSGSGGSGSDSGAATELGLASGTGSMNGSVTAGNNSESATAPAQTLEHNRTQSKNPILQQHKPATTPPESKRHLSRGAQSPYYNNPRGNSHGQGGQISTQKFPPLQSWTRSRLSDIVENDSSHRNTTRQFDRTDGTRSVQQNSRERMGGNKVGAKTSHVDGHIMAQHSSSQNNGEAVPVQRKAVDIGSQLHAPQDKHSVHGNAKDTPSVPKTSLQVLSTVVDMVQKDAPPERSPAAGWATAAAARRAHRAKVIRSRKPPLPALAPLQGEPGNGRKPQLLPVDSSGHGDCERMPQSRDGGNERGAAKSINEDHLDCPRPPTPCANVPEARESSPPTAPHGNETHCIDRDTQIRPPGPTNNVTSEFSTSHRPSVSDIVTSNGGSGSGGSLENSDTGEEEPKSSNDGSGDDVNRQSPSTRDSSPGDPASSGSRENTPNANSPDGNDGSVPSPREHCPMGARKEGQHAPASDPVNQVPTGGRDRADETIKKVAAGGGGSQEIAAGSGATQARAPANRNMVNTGPGSKIPVSVDVSITRRPQTIANLCSAAPEEICSADDSRKRPRSIIREGLATQNSENGNEEMEESAKRRRQSLNSSVGALLNKTQDSQSGEPDATMAT